MLFSMDGGKPISGTGSFEKQYPNVLLYVGKPCLPGTRTERTGMCRKPGLHQQYRLSGTFAFGERHVASALGSLPTKSAKVMGIPY